MCRESRLIFSERLSMKNPENSHDPAVSPCRIQPLTQKSAVLRRGTMAFGLVVALSVGGCSSLPDYANPVSWFDDASDTVGSWVGGVTDSFEGTWLSGWFAEDDPGVAKTADSQLTGDSANARYVKAMTAAANPSAALASPSPDSSNLWPRKPAPGASALLPKTASQKTAVVPPTVATKTLVKPIPAPAAAPAPAPVPEARTAVVTNAPAPIPTATAKPASLASTASTNGATQAPPAALETTPQNFSLKKFFRDQPSSNDQQSSDQQTSVQLETAMNFGNLLGTSALPSASDQSIDPMSAVIYFANGSSRIDAAGRDIVAKFVKLAAADNSVITVIGHASQRTRDMDPVTHKLVNLNVSVKRANAVVAELLRRGVARDQIEAIARGASMPLYLEVMPAGEAGNRRVEIFIEQGS